jgi:hypothetical protein
MVGLLEVVRGVGAGKVTSGGLFGCCKRGPGLGLSDQDFMVSGHGFSEAHQFRWQGRAAA